MLAHLAAFAAAVAHRARVVSLRGALRAATCLLPLIKHAQRHDNVLQLHDFVFEMIVLAEEIIILI